MLATLMTLTFLAVAALAMAVISASLAKGLAAATALRQQLAHCGDARNVTIRHDERTRPCPMVTARVLRRPARAAALPVQLRQREAA